MISREGPDTDLNSTDFSDSEFDARLAEKGIAPGTRRLTSGEFLCVWKRL